jgi:hypothetical protein
LMPRPTVTGVEGACCVPDEATRRHEAAHVVTARSRFGARCRDDLGSCAAPSVRRFCFVIPHRSTVYRLRPGGGPGWPRGCLLSWRNLFRGLQASRPSATSPATTGPARGDHGPWAGGARWLRCWRQPAGAPRPHPGSIKDDQQHERRERVQSRPTSCGDHRRLAEGW